MVAIEDQISKVNSKLQHLLKLYQHAQKENEKLKAALHQLQLSKEKQEEEQARLQQQVSILKTSLGQMTAPDKKAFEKQINQYLKEIDQCITLLSE